MSKDHREFSVEPYSKNSDKDSWDEFVRSSCNGTFLHSQKFLSYHGDRFEDYSFVCRDGIGTVRAVFPAAKDLAEIGTITSHPGSSFGGLIHDRTVVGLQVVEIIEQLVGVYRKLGFEKLIYKSVPWIFHNQVTADCDYALQLLGAIRRSVALSACLDIGAQRTVTKGRKYSLSLAKRNNLLVDWGNLHLSNYWDLLENTLLDRHNSHPVHSRDEIESLLGLFPEEIFLCTSWKDNELLSGIVLFLENSTLHLQYSATSDAGLKQGANDLALESAFQRAKELNCKWFNFGHSIDPATQSLNSGLYEFKRSFGAGSISYEIYEISL